MSTFLNAMQTNDSLTENGMTTNSTSLNLCVDLFFQIGAMRGEDKQRLINSFVKAYSENPLYAMKLLFWARDVRGGAGERQIFRDIVNYMATKHTDSLSKNLHLFSEFGRWDDLLVLVDTPLETKAFNLIGSALETNSSLVAKWMPRPNVNNLQKKRWANSLRKHLGLTPKEYRKLLVNNSKTVEQLMCSKNWSNIEYSKLPSKAMSDLMKAFSRNDLNRFQKYLTSVEKGETKINAGAVYPYDIIKNLQNGSSQGADAQWNSLPNYMEDSNEIIVPLVDVSGSMDFSAGGSSTITCMDVAISLGLYISERNKGEFKDAFISFHSSPTLIYTKGSLSERYSQMKNSPWGGSTNLQASFKIMLNRAKSANVVAEEMPTMMIILSDMEFDSATDIYFNDGCGWNPKSQDMISKLYEDAGYVMPKIVYWNLNSRGDKNKPVSFDEQGTCLVSGFNVNILTNLLSGKDMSPISMMLNVIESKRYDSITI